jgi:xanthine dehydrogenase accessory factor
MRAWLRKLSTVPGPLVLGTVIASEGSAPREVGARMIVASPDETGRGSRPFGTIGGGVLEAQETWFARDLLNKPHEAWRRVVRRTILGPDADQCCGGVVEVLHEVIGVNERLTLNRLVAGCAGVTRPVQSGIAMASAEDVTTFAVAEIDRERQIREPLFGNRGRICIYGAGHVGKALIHVLAPLDFELTCVQDVYEGGDSLQVPPAVVWVNPYDDNSSVPRYAEMADAGSIHLVRTHSHDLDYAICASLLRRNDFAFLGLIGSQTKRARFVQRFRRAGIGDEAIARLVCPIGDACIVGKEPAVIAVAVAAQLLQLTSIRSVNN